MSETVQELLIKIRKGNTDAFQDFYNRYSQKVYQFTGYFVKTDVVCEEIVSDVFLSVWLKRENITGIHNIDAYLYTIAKNKAFNYLETVKRTPEFIPDVSFDIAGPISNPEEMVVTEELRQAIQSSIDRLPERCKLVFLLSRDRGLRYQDIAEILSISEKTVNAQIVTALKKLHENLKKYLISVLF